MDYKNFHGSLKKMTIVIEDDSSVTTLDFLAAHDDEDEAMAAVKAAVREYLASDPPDLDPDDPHDNLTWGQTAMYVPASIWAAHGLFFDPVDGFGTSLVSWDENVLGKGEEA